MPSHVATGLRMEALAHRGNGWQQRAYRVGGDRKVESGTAHVASQQVPAVRKR